MSTTVDTTDQDQTGSGLQTSRGTTTIADGVVAKIASLAAREVRGVASLGGGAANAFGSVVGRLRGQDHSTAGVGVEVGQSEAAVDLAVRVLYPEPMKDVADELRGRVIDRIQSMTGLNVVEVNVQVVDLVFPGDTSDDDGSPQQGRVQ